jgi:hypothetical protein
MSDDAATPTNVLTPNLGLNKPAVGGDDDVWGGLLNANADVLDAALAGGGPFLPLTGGTLTGVLTVPQINTSGGADLILPQHLQSGGLTFWPPGGAVTFSGATGTPYINIGTSFVGSLSSATAFLGANMITVNRDTVAAPLTNSMSWLGINGNIGYPTTWAPSTAYATNASVTLHGRIYQATTGGTSAASGGPSGTGGAITDGTVVWAYQSPNSTGDRSGFFVQLTAQSEGGDVTAGRAVGAAYVAVGAHMQIAASQGGTNLTTSAAGGGWGANFLASIGSQVQNFGYLCGAEVDIAAVAGSSLKNKIGLLVVQTSQDAVSATNGDDAGILVSAQPQGVGPGWGVGLGFGSPFSGFPIRSTGTIIGTGTASGTQLATHGIDFSGVTFSGFSLRMPSFTVSGAGNAAIGGTLGVTGATTLAGGTFTGSYAGAHTYSGALTLSAAGTALSVTNNATIGNVITIGSGSQNRLNITPGANSTADILFTQSGSAQFEFNGNLLASGWIIATPDTATIKVGTTNAISLTAAASGGTPILKAVGEATSRLFIDGSANGGTQINGKFGIGVLPIAKPTVSGAKGSNAALASLLAALVAYGFVTDSTTA